ncbi:FRG domain-containing protein [Larsenimonas suaedae]|uniref:FRG domain-containing protein n=1 Tax=Larsenimonas suaedae TaxID=1851019 RepID=A0ABU1GRG8_9GAMM|nr:FRG domain-containing protein [Larsenimonas suaedae]MCM2972588.1 FRG domain-containing protein [Larsenimonas suaedae]MDR5894616.1 FRG domain-containing protein [Larsenimonas suaedae]
MYNLIIKYNHEIKCGFIDIDKSRFLEYTEEKLVEKYKNLNESDILSLRDYPCLIASEGAGSKFYVVKIESIERNYSFFRVSYEVLSGLNYDLVESISDVLDIKFRGGEVYRTHWALKSVDLKKVQAVQDAISDFSDDLIDNEFGEDLEVYLDKIESLSDFIEFLSKLESSKDYEWYFRGQASSGYQLTPSLFRVNEESILNKEKEYELCNEILIANHKDFEKDGCAFDKLVRMQHYSLPTRLLDITSNPLVALYFACSEVEDSAGEVFVFKVLNNEVKYPESDSVSCISNLYNLRFLEKEKIVASIDDSESSSGVDVANILDRLAGFVKHEKPFFENRIKSDNLNKIFFVKPRMSDSRIIAQSGAFFIFGENAFLEGTENFSIRKICIKGKDKNKIIKQLDKVGINEKFLFPYIERTSKYLKEKHTGPVRRE